MVKISTILRNADVPQLMGALVKYKSTGDLVGKCAIGVLACESQDDTLHLSRIKTTADINEVFKSYGIFNAYACIYPKFKPSYHKASLTSMIITLNDEYKLTFKELADFLETTFDL